MRSLTWRRPSEADTLLARVGRGEPAAVGEVYDLHHEAVRAFAVRLLGDAASAEDLVHEVFIRLPKLIGGFRGEGSLRSFLTGIAANHARHHIRSAQRRRGANERLGQSQSVSPPPGDDPERNANNRRLVEALNRALDKLPDAQRVAFVLCEVEERTAAEAGDMLGVPEATMRTRLFHARKKLRLLLEEVVS